jgi:hypothetical protein
MREQQRKRKYTAEMLWHHTHIKHPAYHCGIVALHLSDGLDGGKGRGPAPKRPTGGGHQEENESSADEEEEGGGRRETGAAWM